MQDTRLPEQSRDLGTDLQIHYYCFTQAEHTANDRSILAQQLAQIHHAEPFAGRMAIQYLADPDPVSTWLEQANCVHLMALHHADEGVIGFGVSLERPGFIGGQPQTLGYFASLKLLPAWRGRIRRIAEVYHWMYELTRDRIDTWYTTILSENTAALKLLTKPRRSMPSYLHQGRYRVFCLGSRSGSSLPSQALSAEQRFSLTSALSPCDLALDPSRTHCLDDAHFFTNRSSSAYIKDLRAYKQYRMSAYEGSLRFLHKLPTQWLGYPRFPRAQEEIRWVAGQLIPSPGADGLADCEQLLQACRHEAKLLGAELLLIGAMEGSPVATFLQRSKHVSYTSELFLVDWEKQGLLPLENVQLDLAFL